MRLDPKVRRPVLALVGLATLAVVAGGAAWLHLDHRRRQADDAERNRRVMDQVRWSGAYGHFRTVVQRAAEPTPRPSQTQALSVARQAAAAHVGLNVAQFGSEIRQRLRDGRLHFLDRIAAQAILGDVAEALRTAADRSESQALAVEPASEAARFAGALALFHADATGDPQWLDRSAAHLDEAIELAAKRFRRESPQFVVALRLRAAVDYAAGDEQAGERRYREALTLAETKFGADDDDILRMKSRLARRLHDAGRHDEVETILRRLVAFGEANLPPTDDRRSRWLNDLGVALRGQERFAEAEEFTRRSVALAERSLPADHPQLAARIRNHASGLQALDRHDEAEPLLRRAVEIAERTHGPDARQTADRLGEWSDVLLELDRYGQAETVLRRLLTLDRTAYGENHTLVALDRRNLASALLAQGRRAEAEPLLRQASEVLAANLGAGHAETVAARELQSGRSRRDGR